MKIRNAISFYLMILALLLALLACSPAAPEQESLEPDEASATQTRVAAEALAARATAVAQTPAEETIMVSAAEGLLINEDPPRTSLFKLNSLAYDLPGMDAVEVVNITYAHHGDTPLTMDVYYPAGTADGDRLPVVVFGLGYRMSKQRLRNEHFYTSWGKLVAAADMIAVIYDTEQPDQDLEVVMAFIRENAGKLRVDTGQIGFMATSANGPTVMSYLMQPDRDDIHFAVYYYALSLTPDGKYTDEFSETCKTRGCLVDELASVSTVNPDMPVFIVQAGQDFIPNINEGLDHFADYVRAGGAPVTVIYYEDGEHGFDTQQRNEESAQIIAQTVDFMRANFGLEAAAAGALVLHNGTVVTAAGDDPIPDAAVVVEDGLITAVGPAATLAFPEGATLIDAQGGTILPGLIDARASDLLNRLEIEDGQLSRVALEFHLKDALEAGVTTVRATGWDWEKQQGIVRLRSVLETHGHTIPTVVIAGTSLAHGEGSASDPDQYADQIVGVTTVDEAREATEALIGLGVDQVNLLQSITPESGDIAHAGLRPILSREQLEAIVSVAHDQGKWVVGQAVFPAEAADLVAAGVDQLANWPSSAVPIPEELIELLVERQVPVVSGFGIVTPQVGDVRRFLDAGGTLVFGTYAPNARPLSSPAFEFRVMELMGMTPMEMIEAATINAARAIGLGDTVGTLEPGKQADIIVVDGDPFEDFDAIRDVVVVVKGGELVVRPEG